MKTKIICYANATHVTMQLQKVITMHYCFIDVALTILRCTMQEFFSNLHTMPQPTAVLFLSHNVFPFQLHTSPVLHLKHMAQGLGNSNSKLEGKQKYSQLLLISQQSRSNCSVMEMGQRELSRKQRNGAESLKKDNARLQWGKTHPTERMVFICRSQRQFCFHENPALCIDMVINA